MEKGISPPATMNILKTDRENHIFRPAFLNRIVVLSVHFNVSNQNSYIKISQ